MDSDAENNAEEINNTKEKITNFDEFENNQNLNLELNPKLLNILSPDSSEFITLQSLKNMILTALGDKFTDEEIEVALRELGVPDNKPIHQKALIDIISTPLSFALRQNKDLIGKIMTADDWQRAMAKIGVDLTLDEIEKTLSKPFSTVRKTSCLNHTQEGVSDIDGNDSTSQSAEVVHLEEEKDIV